MGKLKLLLTVFCAVILASTDDAKAIGYPLPPINLGSGDRHELGQVLPGTLAGDVDREQYVNRMIGLPLGGSDHVIINGQDSLVTRSNNDFGPLLGPATLALTGEGMIVNLGTQGAYDYLLVKYDGPNAVSQVWHIGDLTGIIIIPAIWGDHGPSSWALLGPTPNNVPDGGATLMLLGTALGALGMARRFLKR
jgi:VPDSG-CTERM motif